MKLQGQFWLEAGSYDAGASVPIAVAAGAVPLLRRQQRYPKAIGLLIGSVGKIAARCDMADEYDPFADADPEEDAAAASGGGDSAPAAEKIVMKLDAGKKKTKVAAVFDVRGRSAAVP
jgi:hypothetical protein